MVEERAAEEQFELVPALARAREAAVTATARTAARERAPVVPAPERPVARVLVDVPLAHLDRPFDYLVPEAMHDLVASGSRVKVRFAGQEVGGFVLDRVAESEHPGRLSPLRRAVSPEPVLSREVAALSEVVAERYAGTRSDVLRLAVPPRHARVEKQASRPAAPPGCDVGRAVSWWGRYAGGARLVTALAGGAGPRAVWTALPGEDWAAGLAHAAAATLSAGRGVLLCVPDRRDLARVDAALTAVLGAGGHVLLTAEAGPAERYRSFLAVARGAVRLVAGTRAAAFAPVHDLGLVAIWDDGDDLHAEPRAPYSHAREVLLLRSQATGCGVLVGATSRSVEAATLVATGWAADVAAARANVRDAAPRVAVTGATDVELERDPLARSSRLPGSAFATIREALGVGPVLVQTPRTGYAVTLACGHCRELAHCPGCSGPLHQPRVQQPPSCRWCGTTTPRWECPHCGGGELRAPVRGERRTAEELGRAFPQVPVRRSSGERVLDSVDPVPAIVVATPGAEPTVEGGYAAVVVLDTQLALARADLRVGEESVRRWFNAATLARPASRGGRVLLVGDPAQPALQALVRWDPAGFAARESADRRSAHLPPASRLAVLTGGVEAVEAAVGGLELPPGAELLGPVPVDGEGGPPSGEPDVRVVVRVPRRSGPALSRALRAMQGVRAAKKLAPVRVQVDPPALG